MDNLNPEFHEVGLMDDIRKQIEEVTECIKGLRIQLAHAIQKKAGLLKKLKEVTKPGRSKQKHKNLNSKHVEQETSQQNSVNCIGHGIKIENKYSDVCENFGNDVILGLIDSSNNVEQVDNDTESDTNSCHSSSPAGPVILERSNELVAGKEEDEETLSEADLSTSIQPSRQPKKRVWKRPSRSKKYCALLPRHSKFFLILIFNVLFA